MEAAAKIEQPKEASKKSLATKLAEVMGEVERVAKNGRNDFHKYDYATEADVLAAVRKGLSSRSVIIIPSAEAITWRETAKGGPIATIRVKFRVEDGESGEFKEFCMYGEGQDAGDKATYKAMTGAEKYAMLKLFLIPTGDDPEMEKPAAGHRTAQVAAQVSAKVTQLRSPPEEPPHDEETGEVQEEMTVPFGKSKGQPLSKVDDRTLGWLRGVAAENVRDPAKAKYKQANEQLFDAVMREIQRRDGRQ